MRAFPLFLLVACRAEPTECVDLWAGPLADHVQPYEVAIDASARIVYTTALASRALATFDADSGEPLGTVTIGDRPLDTPDIVVDGAGVVWIGSGSDPALLRYDPADGSRRAVGDFGRVDTLIAREEGVYVLGRVAGERTLVAFDGAGEPEHALRIEATGLVAHPDGVMALAEDGVVLSPELEELDRCELPFAAERGAVLADGTVVVDDDTRVGVCGGASWTVGSENKDVIAWEGGALVLDRLGPDDPNLGYARFVDASGVHDGFVTAKNTGFGVLDPATGLLWANSEGTSEIVAWDPSTGDDVMRTRTGAFVDGLALDPSAPDTAWVTGRLSDTIARVDTGEIAATTDAVRWPYSPVFDAAHGRLWVLSQTAGLLVGLDPETLEVRETFDLGVGPNPLLTFGTVTLDLERGTVLVAESHADTLFEVDPAVGVVTSWPLGGPAVNDPDKIGELVARVDPDTGKVLVARSTDGRIVRVDRAVGVDAVGELPVPDGDRMDLLRVFAGRHRAWYGPTPFDLDTLTPVADALPVSRVVGPVHDEWIAVGTDGRDLLRVDDAGEVQRHLQVADVDVNGAIFRLDSRGDTVWMTRAAQGVVCRFAVEDLR